MNKILKVSCVALAGIAVACAVNAVLSLNSVPAFETMATANAETFDCSAQGWENQSEHTSFEGTRFQVSIDKGNNSNTPKYFTNGTNLRIYGGGTITFTSTDANLNLSSISFTSSAGNNLTTNVATWASPTWTGNSKEVVFTVTGTSGNFRFVSVTVDYAAPSAEPATPTYTVTYNSNGGTGSVLDEDSPYDENAEVTVLSNGFERAGYNFTKWNTLANGEGTTYNPGETFTITANTTLYAQWEEVATPEVFPAGDSYPATMTAGTNGSDDAMVGSKPAIKVGTSSKGGDMSIKAETGAYAITFRAAAWAGVTGLSLNITGVNADPSSVALNADTGIAGNSPFTLASSERAYLFTVTFDELLEDTEITLTSSIAKRFVVWDAKYYINDTTEKFTITYNANGGSGTMPNTVAANPIVAEPTFEAPAGMVFSKWSTDPEGEGDDYAPGDAPAKNADLYAIWAKEIGGNVTMLAGSNSSSAKVGDEDAIKCGTSGKKGEMTLTLKAASITKIKLYAAGWNNDSGKTINVSISEGTISPTSFTVTSDSGISNSSPFTLSATNLTNFKKTFSITNAPKDAVITLEAANASNNRYVVWGATDLFAETFANRFNENLTCNSQGTSQPAYKNDYSWASFKSLYTNLDDEEKGILHDAVANEESDNPIETAMARYDYIVGKYNVMLGMTAAYPDFIDRKPSAPAGLNATFSPMRGEDNDSVLTLAVSISALTLLGIGGSIFLRKKQN